MIKKLGLTALCLATLTCFATPFSASQTKAIEKITHDYLMKNPQILIQMSKKLQEDQVQNAVGSNAKQIFDAPETPVVGNKSAKINVVEFFDYQCPHCKRMGPIIDKLLAKHKNVRFVFKEFPIFGKVSMLASSAALASQRQDKYMKFHDALMESTGRLNEKRIMSIAKGVGLDITRLKKDMKSPAIAQELRANMMLAQGLGVNGTPAFVIGVYPNSKKQAYQLIPGATNYDALNKAVAKY